MTRPSTLFTPSAPSGHHGFTLIELVVSVGIVAVLAAVALPGYRSYVLRAHRADALFTLTQNQTILERCYAQDFGYNAGCAALASFPQTSAQGFYSVALTAATATTYTLTATPLGTQLADTSCASISVDQANRKVATDNSGVAQSSCWTP